MKKTVKLFSFLMVICMLLSSCAQSAGEVASIISNSIENNSTIENTLDTGAIGTSSDLLGVGNGSNSHAEHLSASSAQNKIPEKGTYNEGVALVKYDGELNDNVLSQIGLVSATELYSGSSWYTVELKADANTVEAVTYLRELGCFESVDYDYIMGVGAEVESVDISGNPAHGKQNDTFKTHHVKEGWDYLKKNGMNPGGSSDVVIAVIDTGVDYTHLDLRNNIWVNSAEIPDNGIDDDGNGYIDDLCGWDCVGDDKDPMDDNGHGTHVAGIIAAENNKEGGVGVAFNCKVMVLKAGNSSGYFNNSDIAEAVQYAYMNGADVINMSFGGSSISIAVEEALENAYNTCILVAAAGNDGACNVLGCPVCDLNIPHYPASLPYVIGVMSTDKGGKKVSSFSNYDHYPHNSIEYEVYAVGEGVYSTWPNNKYATLNGTSMAAPMVSGIAALLRSYYTDREVYSTKFIQSQIVNTGIANPHNPILETVDSAHSLANAYEALTRTPTPEVNLYDYHVDDRVSINANNNGNGVIDAGETVRLYISLHNRGGVASNVNASIDTIRNNDPTLTDPYFTFVNTTLHLSDIGTYSVRECTDDQYFEIVVSPECPNDYLVDLNIRFTYENGMNEKDNTSYSGDGVAQFNVSRGFHLPATINEDTVYKADRLYIVGQDVVISKGVTVTFEEGCEIQFYDDREYYNSPEITVYGNLLFLGTKGAMVSLKPNDTHSDFVCYVNVESGGTLKLNYVKCVNLTVKDGFKANRKGISEISNSHIKVETERLRCYHQGSSNSVVANSVFNVGIIQDSFLEANSEVNVDKFMGNYIVMRGDFVYVNPINTFENNILGVSNYFSSGNYLVIDNSPTIKNNMFTTCVDTMLRNFCTFAYAHYDWAQYPEFESNSFCADYQEYANQIIEGYLDEGGVPRVNVYGSLADASLLWPYVVSVEMFDKDGNAITRVGKEEIKVRITFNRPMDVNANTSITFGTIEPYADYRIDGEYISDTVWEGTYTLKAQIENGQNFLKVNNAWAAEDATKTVFGEYQLHEFTIDTTAAMSMNLQAVAKENGIELTFAQDDYDTLLGYNVYRSTDKDGNFVKLNPAILLPDELTFLDENAEPGETYWYTYTVVLTDFTESNPAGKVQATAMDTMAPSLYHTPVNQGYLNNNLVISCTATDNVGIQSVILYYRTVGTTDWKTLSMVKQNDKFSIKIYGNELTLDGLEYYIVAYDENNSIAKGSAEVPYTVVIKEASAISRKGDVDGDGTVTTKDALMLMQCRDGNLILSDDEFRRADLNGDGILSSSEALRILQYINGKVNTLEM